MSRSNRAPQKPEPEPQPPAPLKPRKAMFILSAVIFAGWMAFLIALYFVR